MSIARMLAGLSFALGNTGTLFWPPRPVAAESVERCVLTCSCWVEPLPLRAAEWRGARDPDARAARPERWFVGQVTAIARADSSHLRLTPAGRPVMSGSDIVTTFAVTKSWSRGDAPLPEQVQVLMSALYICPKPRWRVGERYLVDVAPDSNGVLMMGPCTRETLASDSLAVEAMRALGAPATRTTKASRR